MAEGDFSAEPVELIVSDAQQGLRLDVLLAETYPAYSRGHLTKAIKAGGARVDGKPAKPSHRLTAGERVEFSLPALPREGPEPENIPLELLYEDEHLVAINKPPGMIVHPAKGHWSGTLASALAYHFDQLSTTGGPTRPGIVHRLDRDTSGVIVVAKTDAAHFKLAEQFEQRTTEKEYRAIVRHAPPLDRDRIDFPIGPHPHQRDKMALRKDHPQSREAQTYYEVLERFDGFAYLKLLPKTGRTHQIRVHLTHVGSSVLCDKLYGGGDRVTLGEIARDARQQDVLLDRQALHAQRLRLDHPRTGKPLEFVAPVPEDMQRVLAALRAWRSR